MQNDHRNRKPKHLDESGFTLLEIIAVIVILSIMAVVAVPKYFDLQEEARQKTLKTALAEGIGRINGYFAQQVLKGDSPSRITYSDATLGTNLGDFKLTTSVTGDTITIEVAGHDDTPLRGYTASREIRKPGF